MGLKIRDINDNSPPLITRNQFLEIETKPSPSNTNVINKLWTLVMDKVTDVIDYVLKDTASHMMDESIDGDRCDGCDGIFQKSTELKNNVETDTGCNIKNKEDLEKKEISQEFLNMPSHRGTKDTQQYIVQGVTDNSNAITVGDLVIVEDAPSYWSWASPFTVQSIDGEMARLEMIDELVEIARLSLS